MAALEESIKAVKDRGDAKGDGAPKKPARKRAPAKPTRAKAKK